MTISHILQYKTQYIEYIGLPVTNVALEIFVQLLNILSLYKQLYIYKYVYLYVVVVKLIS